MTPRLERPEDAARRLQDEKLSPNERVMLWERIESSAEGRRSGAPAGIRVAAFVCVAGLAMGIVLLLVPRGGDTRDPSPRVAACELQSAAPSLRLPTAR
jgi:hypothetical protein